MGRHSMVERDDFFAPGHGMVQAESGLVSVDVWDAMVAALRTEDIRDRYGSPWALSRGRHHRRARGWLVPTEQTLQFSEEPACTELRCVDQARGFCGASVDGYCVGGTHAGRCHG